MVFHGNLNRKTMVVAAMCMAVFCALAGGRNGNGGWTPKFYPGLEADGCVKFTPGGFRGANVSIDLAWTGGMPKFGVAKRVSTELKGVVDWMVSAYVRCGESGRVAVAMEFFDGKGRSLGIKNGLSRMFRDWTRVDWKFTSPRDAEAAEVHLLSLSEAPVSFARVKVSSAQGQDMNDIPFAMAVLPAEWNRDWNGGRTRMLNFSDAPIPMTVLLRGDRKKLKSPAFEIDIPEELEIKDAFCAFSATYGRESPTSAKRIEKDGMRLSCLRFENFRYLPCMNAVKFQNDKGGGIAFVIGPKSGGERLEKTFKIACRTMDGKQVATERVVEMEFRPLPTGLKTAKRFFAMGWNNADRRFSDNVALAAALRAYEAAGIRAFRLDTAESGPFPRVAEMREILEKRPVPYVFAARLGDMWSSKSACVSKKMLAGMGGRFSVTSDREGRRANKICPQFFTTNEAFHRHLEEHAIFPKLRDSGVKDGDWVTMDMEPWQSGTYCFCEDCRKAFAAFAKLDHMPTMEEAQGMRDAWAEFRVRHSAKTVELIEKIVHKFNPTLKLVDYDYIIEYGNPSNRAAFIRGCAKDTLMNEQWLEGHLCSYYHRIGRLAFDAMKNNVRHLKKFYVPMAGLSGYASWVRPGEVLNPRQIRQFALAAFVNGCPGYAFYSGNSFDGEVLLKMMEAQDIVARYEGLPWGKVDGKSVPACADPNFASASTVRPDGTEVVVLFNYNADESIRVTLAGQEHEIEPYGVKFVEEDLE